MQGWLVRPLRRSMTKVLQRGLLSTLAGLEQESVRRAAARRDTLLTR